MHIQIKYPDGQQDGIADTDLAPFDDVLLTLAAEGVDAIIEFFRNRRWPVDDATIDLERGELTLQYFDPDAAHAAATRWMTS